jgi:hypothetical protein
VSGSEFEARVQPDNQSAIDIYCMAALIADEASRSGFKDFAGSIEAALADLLGNLPRGEQWKALRFSYEMALGGEEPAPPRLRLVYSRD